jgi:hypothetical protein
MKRYPALIQRQAHLVGRLEAQLLAEMAAGFAGMQRR